MTNNLKRKGSIVAINKSNTSKTWKVTSFSKDNSIVQERAKYEKARCIVENAKKTEFTVRVLYDQDSEEFDNAIYTLQRLLKSNG